MRRKIKEGVFKIEMRSEADQRRFLSRVNRRPLHINHIYDYSKTRPLTEQTVRFLKRFKYFDTNRMKFILEKQEQLVVDSAPSTRREGTPSGHSVLRPTSKQVQQGQSIFNRSRPDSVHSTKSGKPIANHSTHFYSQFSSPMRQSHK